MSGLMQYSAITTKLRAMDSRLLKKEDYERLAAMESVSDALAYLKKIPVYGKLLENRDVTQLHRGQFERLATGTLYYDFTKIYRFCDSSQRKLLDLYFSKYEIAIIKRAFRRVMNHQDRTAEERSLRASVQRFSEIPLDKLAEASTVEEILEALQDTRYMRALSKLSGAADVQIFDYEMVLDLYYFSMMWKEKNKLLKGKDLELLTKGLGSRIDMLNMMWIYRAKKYYQLPEGGTYALIIPVMYKLRDDEIRAMVTAADEKELDDVVRGTFYGRHFLELDGSSLEYLYRDMLHTFYSKEKRKDPYSLAVITDYLFNKEREIDMVTTVLEGVRYGLQPGETMKYVERLNGGHGSIGGSRN